MKSRLLPVLLFLVCNGAFAQMDEERVPLTLQIVGHITDGEKKMAGCKVTVYEGNDVVGEQVTDKNGRFGLGMGMQRDFAIVFEKEGFLPKRMIVNTHAKIPQGYQELPPVEMEMSMLPAEKYEGADTDVLDFPFAMIQWDRQLLAFTQDQQYTVGMMRANGAALLQAGRSVKH